MFRRTGSVSCFAVEGRVPEPGSDEFAEALANERFKSIETAASELESMGWITPGDPTGDSFDWADMDGEHACWLRLRMDKKSLPATWVAIHRCAAEHARGRPLTRRELRELKEGLERDMLPRVLPTVRLIDALYVHDRKRVLLFSTGKGVCEEFAKLFQRTFDAVLLGHDPRVIAQMLPLGRDAQDYLDQVSPVRWRKDEAMPLPDDVSAVEEVAEEVDEAPEFDAPEHELAAGEQA